MYIVLCLYCYLSIFIVVFIGCLQLPGIETDIDVTETQIMIVSTVSFFIFPFSLSLSLVYYPSWNKLITSRYSLLSEYWICPFGEICIFFFYWLRLTADSQK
ncbi:hypothetical protein EDC96DRAFT_496127 [Choanephora cucurbitarum]|nr:hypothetical protein EDC96DRAFT_496127 [Choanephora cucurbitarum]